MTSVRKAYAGESRRTRLHVWVRSRSCPLEAVASFVADDGRILDIGCGHGIFCLFLAEGSRRRSVTGVDIDDDKIRMARRAAKRLGTDNLSFATAGPDWTPEGAAWDVICVNDVLYLLGEESARALLRNMARGLAPGGTVLVKEISLRPRWKYGLAFAQELAATKVLRITEGEQVSFLPPAEIAAELNREGLRVEHVPLDRHRLHPHHLVIGRRP